MLSKLKSHQIYFKMCTSEFEGTSNIKWFWANSLPSHSLVSWNHQKLKVFNRKFFLISILAKGSILDVWQGSEYTNEYGCKILAKRVLMRTGKHKNRGVLVREEFCLVYIFTPSLHSVSSVWFFKHQDSFFHFLHYILSFIL